MKLSHFILSVLGTAVLIFSGAALSAEQNKIDNLFLSTEQAQDLQQGLSAYERENLKQLQALAEKHTNGTVSQYLQAWLLVTKAKKQPENVTYSDEVQAFLKQHRNDYIAERLRTDLLQVHAKHLFETQQWHQFSTRRQQLRWNANETAFRCWDALARLESAKTSDHAGINNEILSILKTPSSHRIESCQRATERMLEKTPQTLFPLLIILAQQNRLTQSKQLLSQYEKNPNFDYKQTLQALSTPQRWYWQHRKHLQSVDTNIALLAAFRLSREDPKSAINLAKALTPRLTASEKAAVWGRIGYLFALSHDPNALQWYRLGGPNVCHSSLLTDQNTCLQWHARAALGQQQWDTLGQIIDRMPEQLKNQSNWIYWRARVHAHKGQQQLANRLYARLSNVRTYYGKLAAEELGQSILYPHLEPQLSNRDRQRQLDKNDHFARAQVFYSVGMNAFGNREWNWGLRGKSQAQLIDVAQWAQHNGILHRMIHAAERSGSPNVSHGLLYPKPLYPQIQQLSKLANIDERWVYGLIRQESRFINSARSHVGASGLMQLMPTTAHWVAQQIKMPEYNSRIIYQTDVNLRLGTAYLRLLLNRLDDNLVLATTAYNAGPHRAVTWRSHLKSSVEGAIFIETIPFTETRTYVQNVMANTIEYSQRSERPITSIKQLLGHIEPQPITLKDRI